MDLLDKFRKRWEQRGQRKSALKKKHVVSADAQARAAFKSVPAAGTPGPKPSADQPRPSKASRNAATGPADRVLLRPLVTEKSTRLAGFRQYVFAVSRTANKRAVRQAVRALYGVEPVHVNVLNVRGRAVRYGRTQGRSAAWRKAIVTVASGQKIDALA